MNRATQSETTFLNGTTAVRNLTFSPLNNSHGAQYDCQAVISVSDIMVSSTKSERQDLVVQSEEHYIIYFCIIFSSVPSPMVTVFSEELVLVSGSSLSLSCSIRPILVDTPTTIMSSWTTPNSSRIDNAVNVDLNIPGVVTADSGLYTCSATVIPSSESQYILSSHPGNTSTRIIVSKCYYYKL